MSQVKVKVIAPFDGEDEQSSQTFTIEAPLGEHRSTAETLRAAMGDRFPLLNFRIVQVGVRDFNIIGEPKVQ